MNFDTPSYPQSNKMSTLTFDQPKNEVILENAKGQNEITFDLKDKNKQQNKTYNTSILSSIEYTSQTEKRKTKLFKNP